MTDDQMNALIAVATGQADDAALAALIAPRGPTMSDGFRHVLANAVAGRKAARRRLVEEQRAESTWRKRLEIGRLILRAIEEEGLSRRDAIEAAATNGVSEGRANAALDLARKADDWIAEQRAFAAHHGLDWSDEQLAVIFLHSVRVGDQGKRKDERNSK